MSTGASDRGEEKSLMARREAGGAIDLDDESEAQDV